MLIHVAYAIPKFTLLSFVKAMGDVRPVMLPGLRGRIAHLLLHYQSGKCVGKHVYQPQQAEQSEQHEQVLDVPHWDFSWPSTTTLTNMAEANPTSTTSSISALTAQLKNTCTKFSLVALPVASLTVSAT